MQMEVGAQLGPYRIEDYIGRGGMGVVYRATHVHLGRQVAIKLLAPELAENQSFRERFVRESRVAARVDHPNVIPIYEADDVDGTYFIAMRYVDGTDLREILHAHGPLGLNGSLEVLTQVAGALDAAHAQGLVHRDVKPGNILVVAGSKHCYLTDFGLTKAISSETAFTATGQFVGTTDYVAPEQIEGRELDRRTDVYSLGCVVYECLAGTPPFRRETDMAVMWAHMQEPPPRVTEQRPELPAGLDAVIATAMAKQKDARYPSCSTFAAAARSALELGTGRSYVAATPPAAPPPAPPVASGAYTAPGDAHPPAPPSYPPASQPAYSEPPRRQKPLTAIALVIAALLLAGGGTAAALIITGKKKEPTVTQQASAPVTVTTPPPTSQAAPAPPQPTTDTPSAPSTPDNGGVSSGAEAEKTVHGYWKTLASGDLEGAYNYLDPSARKPHDYWIAARQKDGLYSAKFNRIAATDSSDSRATVEVDLDTKQTSCADQNWVGTYQVVNVGGSWLIHDHNIPNPPPC
jgi:serine/threonine-protein kinase